MVGLKGIWIGFSGFALLITGACKPLPFEDVAASEVKLISRMPEPNPVNMDALILGRLWIVDQCVTIGASADQSRTTIWRAGYRVGEDTDGRFVYHPDKKIRHRIGEPVRLSGGYVETLESSWIADMIDGNGLEGCPGPFILVDEATIRPI